MKRTLIAAAALAALVPLIAGAQGNPQRPGRRGAFQQPQGPPPDSMRRNRQMMEGQIGRRVEERMKTLLNLTDVQMGKVRDINMRHGQRMQMLNQQERDIRMALREEAISGDSTRQTQIADLLDKLTRSMRQRVDLMEQEQKDLAGVLTPLQRATYLGIQEQIRMQVERLRNEQGGRMGPDGGPQGPPPDGMGGRAGLRGRGMRRPPDGPPDGPPDRPIGPPLQ
jgi:Spy/CpxP family protein refolding chaperone